MSELDLLIADYRRRLEIMKTMPMSVERIKVKRNCYKNMLTELLKVKESQQWIPVIENQIPRYTQIIVKTHWETAGGSGGVTIIEMGMLCDKWETESILRHRNDCDKPAWPKVYTVTHWRPIEF